MQQRSADERVADRTSSDVSARAAPAISRQAMIAALAKDRSFGYGRVRAAALALLRAGGEWPVPQASANALRALLAECADARSACALAPVRIPIALAGDFERGMSRIRTLAACAPGDYFRVDNDAFNKDLATCFGHLFPCGARMIDLRAALPRLVRRQQPLSLGAFLRSSRDANGSTPWFQIHLDTRELSDFTEEGLVRTYRRAASLLEANPQVGGVFGGTWYYDPCVETLSPHLAYVRRLPCAHGARLVRGETSALTVRRALLKSRRRREAYEQGSYRPRTYYLVWSREDLIHWAGMHSPDLSGQPVADRPGASRPQESERRSDAAPGPAPASVVRRSGVEVEP